MGISAIWNKELIKIGIQRFINENHRIPSGIDFDTINYLPSAKQVQRKWGGIPKVRELCGITELLHRGRIRGETAKRCNVEAINTEELIERFLINKFGEEFVHREAPIRKRSRFDFYIYNPDGNFAVDIFLAKDIHSFRGSLDIKLKKYISYLSNNKIELFIVPLGKNISKEDINNYIKSRKALIPVNIKLLTINEFTEEIRKRRRYYTHT